MYFSLILLIFAFLLIFILGTCRRRQAVKKVCSMTAMEKCVLLNSLIKPFGYCYDEIQDIISSHKDAWQRKAGYTSLFDRYAPFWGMVFDYLPVYFPYQDRTWLIEFWKGQYGINTGGEIGVYCADRLLSEKEFPAAHFQAADNKAILSLSFCLMKGNAPWHLSPGKPGGLPLFAWDIFPDRGSYPFACPSSFLTVICCTAF